LTEVKPARQTLGVYGSENFQNPGFDRVRGSVIFVAMDVDLHGGRSSSRPRRQS
jgi:hypothetical protein